MNKEIVLSGSTQSKKRKNIEAIYPLTPVQHGMLFHSLLDPESGIYIEQTECTLRGKLDVTAFEQAWRRVVDRHEILRTGFFWDRVTKPLQIVSRRISLPLNQQDWRSLSPEEQQARWKSFLTEDCHRGFDVASAPLMHFTLVRMAEYEYRFLWSYHHVLLDGWSLPLLFREVFAYYSAISEGSELRLKSPRPYRDYISWLQRQDLNKAETYWRAQLAGFETPTLLSKDLRLGGTSAGCAMQALNLPASTTRALNKLARRQRLTINTLLQGGWALLLSRYTGIKDVVFGVTVSGRPAELIGVESMIGLFINTLPLRVKIASNAPVLDWLQKLQTQNLSLREYGYAPLVDVLKLSDVPRGMPLFDSLLIFENFPMDPVLSIQKISHLEVSNVQNYGQDNYHVTLFVWVEGDEIKGYLLYDTELFDEPTMVRMVEHFHTLLEGIAGSPNARLMDFSMLGEAEQRQLLKEWNVTQAEYPHNSCVHQLLESQAKSTPEATAVALNNATLSYADLNARANQVACYLKDLGVGPDVLVAICVRRSLEMAVGLIGILKAGGAYLPLDPAYPKERLAFMLTDSQAQVLLTQRDLLQALPDTIDARVACLDADWQEMSQYRQDNPINDALPENLAYVMYTSGSTGEPKGVAVTHQALSNHCVAMARAFDLRFNDRILQFSSPSFDIAVEELFPSWLTGARVVFYPYQTLVSASEFLQLIEKERLTVLDLPTSYWRQWVYELSLSKDRLPACLRLVVVGGEKVSAESFESWQNIAEFTRWINTYGPTEATVTATFVEYSGDVSKGSSPFTPSIGRPIANIQAYILDSDLNPVPIGISGELHLGGVGLARGYLHRPALTAEKFILNPFSSNPGARLYKTGDLARYLTDGNIEFIGRVDFQVKIRGYRVELGEIETTLGQHEAVHEAVVMAREDSHSGQRLVAYVVLKEGRASEITQLRSFLEAQLPQYMVPSAFVILKTLPLTPNGKVDRKALPSPEGDRPVLAQIYVAPRTPTEDLLAGIEAEVLRVERVGIYDNFFDLGGDSILTLQLVARAHQAGFEFTPRQLFEHQTVAELAEMVGTGTAPGTQADQVPVKGSVPLTPIQHWFFETDLPVPSHFNQSVLLEVNETLESSILESAFHYILDHHDALRLRFEPMASAWQQVNAEREVHGIFTKVDLTSYPESEQCSVLEAMAGKFQRSLDLTTGPLLRVALFHLGADQPDRLLLIIHHMAVDGVSWRILLEDLQTVYGQISRKESVALPPKTTSFKQWAERLQEYAQSDALREECQYWLTAAQQPFKSLPVDTPGGTNTVALARTITVSLNPEETVALLQEAPSAYHTEINDLLLTALLQAVSAWTGTQTIWVDLEGHGREPLFDDLDLSRTVGWFTSVFPVCLSLVEMSELGAVIKSIKEQLRRIPHKGLGYGVLRYLTQNPDLADSLEALPQAQISFNYLGQFDQVLSNDGLIVPAQESRGPEQNQQGERDYLLDVAGSIAGGRLCMSWTYSSELYRSETVETIAHGFIEVLRRLIAHCLSQTAGAQTPG